MTITDAAAALRIAFGDHPFTRDQAAAMGVTADRLERAVRAGHVARLRRGVYSTNVGAAPSLWVLAQHRARELRARGVAAVVCEIATAELWDIPILSDDLEARPRAIPTLVVPQGARAGNRNGYRVRHGSFDQRDLMRVAGGALAITGLLRTAIDVVRVLQPRDAFAAATLSIGVRRHLQCNEPGVVRWDNDRPLFDERRTDWAIAEALRRGEWIDDLTHAIERAQGRGINAVRRARPLIQPEVETPLEAISWARMVQSGLPLPMPQAWLVGASGRRYRVDFWWPEYGVIGEADGAAKYRRGSDVIAEKSREADLEVDGAAVVRWTWSDAVGPGRVLERLTSAFHRGGTRRSRPTQARSRPLPALPRPESPWREWRTCRRTPGRTTP